MDRGEKFKDKFNCFLLDLDQGFGPLVSLLFLLSIKKSKWTN